MPLLSRETISERMTELGLSQEQLAGKCRLSPRTIWNVLNGRSVSVGTQKSIADALELSPDVLVSSRELTKIRNISGEWVGVALDIEVPDYFEYSIPSVEYSIFCKFEQTGRSIAGECVVTARLKTRVRLLGRAWEEGNVVQLQYQSMEPELLDYGSIFLQYDPSGEQLSGFFLGREIGHGTQFVLAWIELRRKSPFRLKRAAREPTTVKPKVAKSHIAMKKPPRKPR